MDNAILEDRLIKFSIEVIKYSLSFKKDDLGRYLSDQLTRSSISPALNYAEARAAESKRDFTHKLSIVLKELRESQVNMKIISGAEIDNRNKELSILIAENDELIAIFTKSILTLKSK